MAKQFLEFWEMPKHFVDGQHDRHSRVNAMFRLSLELYDTTLTLSRQLLVFIYLANCHSDVIRCILTKNEKTGRYSIQRLKTDTIPAEKEKDFLHVHLVSEGSIENATDIHLSANAWYYGEEETDAPKFPPTLVFSIFAQTEKTDDDPSHPTGWIAAGSGVVTQLSDDASPFKIHNFHRYVDNEGRINNEAPPKDLGTLKVSGRFANLPKPMDQYEKYHFNAIHADIIKTKAFFNQICGLDGICDRESSFFESSTLIGAVNGVMTRPQFYLDWIRRSKYSPDFIEALLMFNYELFSGQGVNSVKPGLETNAISLPSNAYDPEDRLRNIYLLAFTMFVTRLGYQKDEITVGSTSIPNEVFSQLLLVTGGGDCEDSSYTLWTMFKHTMKFQVSSSTHPHITKFQELFGHYHSVASVVIARVPELQSMGLRSVKAVKDPLIPTNARHLHMEQVQKLLKKDGFFHMVTLVVPRTLLFKEHRPDNDSWKEDWLKIRCMEGTSAAYPEIFRDDPNFQQKAVYRNLASICVEPAAEPGALVVNGDLPLYLAMIDVTDCDDNNDLHYYTAGVVTAEGEAPGLLFKSISDAPANSRLHKQRVAAIQQARDDYFRSIVSLEMPPPYLTIDLQAFKIELRKLKDAKKTWKETDVYNFFYIPHDKHEALVHSKNPSSLVPYLPWNMHCATKDYMVKPIHLGLVSDLKSTV